ncbi:pseudouridine synthase [Gautieria morchelliformis]|nr:pseudouridine synthase [Gautieria morchelliformis]
MRIPRMSVMANSRTLSPYHNWTREDLIARLHQLDSAKVVTQSSKNTDSELFSFSSHPRRKIALKFCYSGSEYNGLAFQKDYTPLPTVEGVLFDALARTRLIDPEKGFEGCQWERCGRTDRGVSAAGQVISLWVRSALEISYIQVLNRVLPSTIRVICWSPISETFSARFSCQFRHYKYFFPASPDLDISRMRDGAVRLMGTHDFRNLCTLDGSKQIENYHRAVHRAEISLVGPDESDMDAGAMYVLDLVGNAFLYNQVRSIMAILFLVGSGLEEPHIISSLLNVDPRNPLPPFRPSEPNHVVDRKPSYQIADGLPLVLWDCGYPSEELRWQTDTEISIPGSIPLAHKESPVTMNLRHQLYSIYTRSRIHATLNSHFLRAASHHHPIPFMPLPLSSPDNDLPLLQQQKTILNVPAGGGSYIRTAKYKPLLTRERGDNAEVVNERWRQGRGKKRWAERLARQAQAGSTQPDDGNE